MNKKQGKRRSQISFCKKYKTNGGVGFQFTEKTRQTEASDSAVHKKQGKRRPRIVYCKKNRVNGGVGFVEYFF